VRVGEALAVPGLPGQTARVRFTWTASDAAYHNELGLFAVDDASGRIGRLRPGDAGYAAAALARRRVLIVFASGQAPGATRALELPSGRFFGMFLVQNGTTAALRARNAKNLLRLRPVAVFCFPRANPDGRTHMRWLPGNVFTWDDGGDAEHDFGDLTAHVDFGRPRGSPPGRSVVPVPPAPPTPAPVGPGGRTAAPAVLTAHLSDDTAPGGTTNNDRITSDPAVAGTVTAPAAVASLRVGFDAAPAANYVDVTAALQPGGRFALDRARLTQAAGGSLPDGAHTLHLLATDADGGSANFDLAFTLDTAPPTVTLTSPAAGAASSTNVTVSGRVTDALSGVFGLEARVDAGTFAAVTLDASGTFSFPTALALDGSADGSHTVTLRGTDGAGNAGTVQTTFALATGLLREGTAFHTSREQDLTIPAGPSVLTFTYAGLSFDTNPRPGIRDAFEAALVDANGQSLVHTIGAGRDAFLNVTDGQPPALGAETTLSGTTVTLNLAGITPGTPARLIYRLINNDSDGTPDTSIDVSAAKVLPNPGGQPVAAIPGAAALVSAPPIDVSALSDVSAAFTPEYGQTAFDEADSVLYANLSLKNTGLYPIDKPLAVAVAHLSDPTVRVRGADGTTPDGLPYYNLSNLVTGRTLNPGDATAARRLAFFNPNHTPFTYDLVVLGQLNRPPAFTTQPGTEAIPGVPYVYQTGATDPDGDPLHFTLLTGPAGMAVDAATGKVAWGPQQSDLGTHAVALRVDDGRGGTAEQDYTITAIVAPPNRPPVFNSTPVVDANVNTLYAYQATATDPDGGETLTFSVVSRPQGLMVDAQTGSVTWTPAAGQLGPNSVTLRVDDGRGGTATQSYLIAVAPQKGNLPPLITSSPQTTVLAGQTYQYQVHAIDADNDPLTYSLTAAPAGMILDGATGQTTWATITPQDVGPHNVGVRVEDGRGGVDTQDYVLTVGTGQPGSIAGTVFNDLNANGVRDATGGAQPAPKPLLDVPGMADPYLAGMPDGSTADPGDTAPVDSPFPVPGLTLTAGSALMFTVPAGQVTSTGTNGPDGGNFLHHGGGGLNGISDVVAPVNSLVGVFLGPGQPGGSPAPAPLDFSPTGNVPGGLDYLTLSPQLKQVFFIGDGRTSKNQVQQVIVPAGATRLFLGAMKDTRWNSNSGSFAVDVRPYDPVNGPRLPSLTVVSTTFSMPVSVDFEESLNELVVSHAPNPLNFEAIQPDGSHVPFTNVSTLTNEVYIAAARSGDLAGFRPGDLFTGNGQGGQIVRITDGGRTVINPWVTLPGETGGPRGGLAFDRTGVFGGDLIVSTNRGTFWRVDAAGHAAKLATLGPNSPQFTEGLTILPDDVARYGPLAGKILALDETSTKLFTVDAAGGTASFDLGVPQLEGAQLVLPNENFFGVEQGGNEGSSRILGAPAAALSTLVGDIVLFQETGGGLFRLFWDGKALQVQPLNLAPGSARAALWEGTAPPGPFGAHGVPAVPQEPGLAGWTVYLDENHNSQLDPGEPSTTTDANGHYAFTKLVPGTYTVAEVGQPGWKETAPVTGTRTVTVLAGQTTSGVDFGNTQLNVSPAPRPPAFTSSAPRSATVGQRYQYNPILDNPDGQALAFDLPFHPAGMVVDPATGVVAWTPIADEAGANDGLLRVRDTRGDVVLQDLHITVGPAGAGPVITSTPPPPAVVGEPFVYAVRAQEAGSSPITYRLDTHPAGMAIDASGLVTWTPAAGDVGTQHVVITATNGLGGQAHLAFDLLVAAAPNQAPAITSTPPHTVRLGGSYRYAVQAADADGDPLTFHLDTAPAGMSIDATGLVSWQPMSAEFGPNAVAVRVDDGRGGAVTQTFTVNVVTQFRDQPPTIVSTPPLAATVGQLYAYNAKATDPENDPLLWTLDTAPAGMSVDPQLGTVRWTPTAEELGPQTVALRVVDAQGSFAVQTFSVAVRGVNVPPVITSTPPTQAAAGQAYSYPVQAGDADGDPLTFSLTAEPAGMSIDASSGLILWTPTAAEVGPQAVALQVDDGQGGVAVQTYTVVATATVPDQPPVITSRPPLTAFAGTAYRYPVLANDPDGAVVRFALPAAPSGMMIDPASGLVQWTPTAAQAGQNATVTVTATDPAGKVASQAFTLAVRPANQPPVITSQPVTTVTAGALYDYDVQANDPDGDPLGYHLATAPQGMTVDAQGRVRWSPAVADVGPHPVALIVSDGLGGTVSQSFTVTVGADTEAPQVSVQVNPNPLDIGAPATVVVSATDNVGVQTLSLTVNGTPVGLDPTGRGSVTLSQAGQFAVVATATDAVGNTGRATTQLTVINPNVTGAPTVALTGPADGAVISAPTDVIGTASDPHLLFYKVEVAPVGSDAFTEVFRGTTSVTNGTLGKFDPTMLQNDSYVLRLTAENTGGISASTEETVNVMGNLKLGNFTLAFTDLSVPVSGIPITVTRTYDTMQAGTSEDFGYGWRLDYRDVRLRTSVPKTGEEANGTFNGFRDGTRVYVTLPGGKREGFTFSPMPEFIAGTVYGANFVHDAGGTDNLTVEGETSNQGSLGVFQNLAGQNGALTLFLQSDGTYTNDAGIPYNPADSLFGGTYFLTTKDGTQYQIDALSGKLQAVADRNGNTLTFTEAGITSSAGPGITFARDPQGRIVSVTDPMGHSLGYQYDADGDLIAVADRLGNTTQYVYRSALPHYLDQVIDPLGRTGTRTTYDAQGRLSQVTDAKGDAINLLRDPTRSIETVFNALGKPTTYMYDERGNILVEEDLLGETIRRTYDNNSNMLTETNPLGNTRTLAYDSAGNVLSRTDPLGNTTRYTYGPFGDILTTTDPLGNTTSNSYDSSGNLVTVTGPSGNTTSYTYFASGILSSIKDGVGNLTKFEYDGAGNLTGQTDSLGHESRYTYDADGNQRTRTATLTTPAGPHTVTTTTDYDRNGNPTSVQDAEGHITKTEYDQLGNQSAVVDALGHRTEFHYDEREQLVETLYAYRTTEATRYDAAGQKVSTTDRAGRTTYFEYDDAARLVTTIYPDNTPADLSDNPRTLTEYDAAGQVKAQVDELGNRTEFAYDDAGQLTVVRDALMGETKMAYDASGNRISETDALGHTTRFAYDPSGHLAQTLFGDVTSTTRTYDPLGRLLAQTDQAGKTTRFEYDPLGRLTAVVDALSQRTEYAYDEAGDLVSRKDGNGHVERDEYDDLGQRTATVLPLGQRSTTVYDPAGNVQSTTDFNGQTMTYHYDINDRLAEEDFPDGTSVRFTYTPTGQRQTVADSRGSTSYTYDERDRLLSRSDPDGTVISYSYDRGGNRTSVTVPAGTTTYTFDPLNRLETVTDPGGRVTRYSYDSVGNLKQTRLPNGTVETRGYDDLNRLVFLQNTGPGGVISSYHYTLGPTGIRTSVEEDTGRRVVYTYDDLYRLTGESITDAANGNRSITYTYDPAGNRLTRNDSAEGLTTYVYDSNDRLLTETLGGHVTTYTYDDNGNVLSKTGGASDRVLMHWDFENRLLRADVTDASGSLHIQNQYDADGLRVGQIVDGQETRYLVDANRSVAEVLEEYTPAGIVDSFDVYGLSIISERRGNALSYYHVDATGSTRALTGESGTVTDRYTYDAFGQIINKSGSSLDPYLYGGEQLDPLLGLYYLRARYYEPSAGRLVSADPLEGNRVDPGSLNAFAYAAQDPVNEHDPLGLFTQANGYEAERQIDGVYQTDHPECFGPQRSLPVTQFLRDACTFGRLARTGANTGLKPDILNHVPSRLRLSVVKRPAFAGTFLEIKPFSASGLAAGIAQLAIYEAALSIVDYRAEYEWVPSSNKLRIGGRPSVFFNVLGVVFYTDIKEIAQDAYLLLLISRLKDIRDLSILLKRAHDVLSLTDEFAPIRGLVALDAEESIKEEEADTGVALEFAAMGVVAA
jgi:RHS repeat-associated protein